MMLKKSKEVEAEPKFGDKKVTIHFAYWPKKVKEGWIWLEGYERHYLYIKRLRVHFIGPLMLAPNLPAWDIIEEKRITCA